MNQINIAAELLHIVHKRKLEYFGPLLRNKNINFCYHPEKNSKGKEFKDAGGTPGRKVYQNELAKHLPDRLGFKITNRPIEKMVQQEKSANKILSRSICINTIAIIQIQSTIFICVQSY